VCRRSSPPRMPAAAWCALNFCLRTTVIDKLAPI
jgi:hypothetical protein